MCRPEKAAAGPESMDAAGERPDGPLAVAVQAELERVKEAGSVIGAVAMRLARALDDPMLPAAQVASLSAQLMRTMEPIRTPAARPSDEVDEFTARLLEKQALAS